MSVIRWIPIELLQTCEVLVTTEGFPELKCMVPLCASHIHCCFLLSKLGGDVQIGTEKIPITKSVNFILDHLILFLVKYWVSTAP